VTYDVDNNALFMKSDFLFLGEANSTYTVTLNEKINVSVSASPSDFINRKTWKLNIDFKKYLVNEADKQFPTSISAIITNPKFSATYHYKRFGIPYYFSSSNTTFISQKDGGVVQLTGSLLPTTSKSLMVLVGSKDITSKCSVTQSSLLCKIAPNGPDLRSTSDTVHLVLTTDKILNYTSQFIYNSFKIKSCAQSGTKGLLNIDGYWEDENDYYNLHLYNGKYEHRFKWINNSLISFDFPKTMSTLSLLYKDVKVDVNCDWNPIIFPVSEISFGEYLIDILFVDVGKDINFKAYFDNKELSVTYDENSSTKMKIPIGINFPYGVGNEHKLYIQRTYGNLAKSNMVDVNYLPAYISDYQCKRSYQSQTTNQTTCTITGERFPLTTFNLYQQTNKLALVGADSNYTSITFSVNAFIQPASYTFSFNDADGTTLSFSFDSKPMTDVTTFTTETVDKNKKTTSIAGSNLDLIYKVLFTQYHPDKPKDSVEIDCTYFTTVYPSPYKEYLNCTLPTNTAITQDSYLYLYHKTSSEGLRLSSLTNQISHSPSKHYFLNTLLSFLFLIIILLN